MGPPAGKFCSPIFMSECCGFTAVPEADTIVPCNALDRHFTQIQASNAMGISRAKAAQQRREELKKEKDASELSSSSTTGRSSSASQLASQLLINLEIRKERRLLRVQEIDRLSWLIKRAALKSDFAKENEWQNQLELLYESPIPDNDSDWHDGIASLLTSPDTPTPRSTPTPVKPALACSISVCAFSPISKLVTAHQPSIHGQPLMFIGQQETETPPKNAVNDAEAVHVGEERSSEDLPPHELPPLPAELQPPVKDDATCQGLETKTPEAPPKNVVENDVDAMLGREERSNAVLADATIETAQRAKQVFLETQQRKHQALFIQFVLCGFKRVAIPKDGHCLFHCFAYFLNRHGT